MWKHRASVSVTFFSLLRWQPVCVPQSRRLDTRPPGLIAQSSSASICFTSRHLGIIILIKVLANSFFTLLLWNMTFTLLNYFNNFLLSAKDITFQRSICGQSFGQNPVALKTLFLIREPTDCWHQARSLCSYQERERVLNPHAKCPSWIKLTRANLWEKVGRLSFRLLK